MKGFSRLKEHINRINPFQEPSNNNIIKLTKKRSIMIKKGKNKRKREKQKKKYEY